MARPGDRMYLPYSAFSMIVTRGMCTKQSRKRFKTAQFRRNSIC